MRYLIFIIYAIISLIECQENYDIKFVDMNKGVRSVSIIGKRMHNSYSFKVIPGIEEKGIVVSGRFIEQINSTGWGHLMITSYPEYSDEVQAYFSGVNEGILTRPLIQAHFDNTYMGYCTPSSLYCKRLEKYLKDNFLSLVKKSRNSRGFLKMIRLQLWQIKGLQDGFDGKWQGNLTELNESYLLKMQNQLMHIYLLQVDGDLSALSNILGGSSYHLNFTKRDPLSDGRCSAFIKYFNGRIFSSHVTWNTYNSMLRITKLYDFPYRVESNEKGSPFIPAIKLSFSSYPGQIASLDDFYVTSAGLVSIETTIGNNNASLWKPLQSKATTIILEYARVLAANRMSTTGLAWSNYFARNNSGTYNNQWMVVNHNLMKNHRPGERLPDGLLYVAEQIPSLVVYQDLTDYLRTSFWSSYNIPYFKPIWQLGGFQANVDKYGDFFDYNKAPRALIFKRNASRVVDETSLMRLMRYNNFQHDPLAKCACKPPYSGENGISARCELNPINGTYPFSTLGYRLHGGTDMKFTTAELSADMRFVGISGPTYDQQPVFDWSKIVNSTMKHFMQPVRFKFQPVMTPFN